MSGSIQVSVTPGQILTCGVSIIITATGILDRIAVHDAISVKPKYGEKFHPSISFPAGRVSAWISTTDFQPGSYDLIIGELFDINQNLMNKNMVIPLTFRAPLGTIPREYNIIHAVLADVTEDSVIGVNHTVPLHAGSRRVEFIKAVHKETGAPLELAFSSDGAEIHKSALLGVLSNRRAYAYGKVHQSLRIHLEGIPQGESRDVDIVVWPKTDTYHEIFQKRHFENSDELSVHTKSFLEGLKIRKGRAIEALRSVGAKVHNGDACEHPAHVLIQATIASTKIKDLAQFPHIGTVFLHETDGFEDLFESMSISQTLFIHNLTLDYQDQNVNVAVFEKSPDIRTELDFSDQYLPAPKTSPHARLTSAIIKNTSSSRELRGYAPKCSLFSANTFNNNALKWAVHEKQCTVVNQSFHRYTGPRNGVLQLDDIYKDWLSLFSPYPLFVEAAGNYYSGDTDNIEPPSSEYVNHKGFNTITVGSHNNTATSVAPTSVFRNPLSTHGDREAPDICANGTSISAVGLRMSGTSFAAAAVSGVAALVQGANKKLKSYPEAMRAILLAGSDSGVTGSSWWDVVGSLKKDSGSGAGSLNARAAVEMADYNWDVGEEGGGGGWGSTLLVSDDFDTTTRISKKKYIFKIQHEAPVTMKVALAWSSMITEADGQYKSVLAVDLDLLVLDEEGNCVASSCSFDNSYEVAEFTAKLGTYSICVRRWSGTDPTWIGIAWASEFTDTEEVMVPQEQEEKKDDKEGIKEPKTEIQPTPEPVAESCMIGTFVTHNHWKTVPRSTKNSALIVNPVSISEFTVLTALTMVDLAPGPSNWNVRVKSFALDLKPSSFYLNQGGWEETHFFNGHISYIMIPRSLSPGIQSGVFDTFDYRSRETPGNFYNDIHFSYPFEKVPTVFVAISGFDIGDNWRLHVFASEVTTQKFKLNVETWGHSDLYGVQVSWIAFLPDREDIIYGEVYSGLEGCYEGWNGKKEFGRKFERTPLVFTGLSYVDVNHHHNMRVKVTTTVCDDGFDWKINKWGDTELHQIGFRYLAMLI